MKMRENELKEWEKTRTKGALFYAFKTATIATIFVLCLFIFSNAYYNYDQIDAYIQYNFVERGLFTFTVSIITYVGLLFLSLALYVINEARYKKTINQQ